MNSSNFFRIQITLQESNEKSFDAERMVPLAFSFCSWALRGCPFSRHLEAARRSCCHLGLIFWGSWFLCFPRGGKEQKAKLCGPPTKDTPITHSCLVVQTCFIARQLDPSRSYSKPPRRQTSNTSFCLLHLGCPPLSPEQL